MADTLQPWQPSDSWPKGPPGSPNPLQMLLWGLTMGAYHTPEQRYNQQIREHEMANRYAQSAAATPASISGSNLLTAENKARLPNVQTDEARREREATESEIIRNTQQRGQFPAGTQSGVVDGQPVLVPSTQPTQGEASIPSNRDASEQVWQPFEAQNLSLQPQSPSPNLAPPNIDEMTMARKGAGGNGAQAQPQIARPEGHIIKQWEDWADAFKLASGKEPSPQESQAFIESMSGRRPLTGEAYIWNMMYQSTDPKLSPQQRTQKATQLYRRARFYGRQGTKPPPQSTDYSGWDAKDLEDRAGQLGTTSTKEGIQEFNLIKSELAKRKGQSANEDQLRKDAKAAIEGGAPSEEVAARYKQLTGKDL